MRVIEELEQRLLGTKEYFFISSTENTLTSSYMMLKNG